MKTKEQAYRDCELNASFELKQQLQAERQLVARQDKEIASLDTRLAVAVEAIGNMADSKLLLHERWAIRDEALVKIGESK